MLKNYDIKANLFITNFVPDLSVLTIFVQKLKIPKIFRFYFWISIFPLTENISVGINIKIIIVLTELNERWKFHF